MHSTRTSSTALLLLIALFFACVGFAQAEEAPPIAKGTVVHLEYTLTDDSGKVIDSNKGKNPLVYTQGSGQIIPGLDKALLGMHEGETKQVTVPPEEAYGANDPRAVMEVSKDRVPSNVQVGTWLQGRNQNGQPIQALVKEIKEQVVILDFNHPLAGKTLNFDIKILSVTRAKTN